MTRGIPGAIRRYRTVTHVLRDAARGVTRTTGGEMMKNNATEYLQVRTISRGKKWAVSLAIVAALYGLSLARVPIAAAQTHPLLNFGSFKCLQPVSESLDEGAPVIQTTCNHSSAFQ